MRRLPAVLAAAWVLAIGAAPAAQAQAVHLPPAVDYIVDEPADHLLRVQDPACRYVEFRSAFASCTSGGGGVGGGGGGGGGEPPLSCTVAAGQTCTVTCTAGDADTGSIIVYASKTGGSGSIVTHATSSCVSGGSVSTTDSTADGTDTTNSASTSGKGTITCWVESVGGATGSGRCWEPHAAVALANQEAFCLLNAASAPRAELDPWPAAECALE